MRKLLIPLFFLLPASLLLPGCGGNSPRSQTSGIPYRAFISDSVSAGSSAGIYIVNAQTDVHPGGLSPIPAGNTPGMMLVTPNRAQTLIFSGSNTQSSDNLFSIINNSSESNAARVTLPGSTESFVISPDSSAAYVAVPTAQVIGQSPGIIEIVSLNTGVRTGEIDIPSVRYLSISNGGNRILAFTSVLSFLAAPCDQTPAFLFVATPSDVGIQPCPATPVVGFDHPVQAYFSSDDSTAYVVNCGAECGGLQAGVQQLDLTHNLLGTLTPVCNPSAPSQCAASIALVDGSTMYLAGSYPNPSATEVCPGQSSYTPTCGLLSVLNLSGMTVTTSGIVITDGYHNRIALGANGQLFVGARTCTEVSDVSGCLSIYNTQNVAVGSIPPGAVIIPPANGDVTGIQPIATRTVVYVVQGGSLEIYDTATDALQFTQITNMVGQFVDVKTVDF